MKKFLIPLLFTLAAFSLLFLLIVLTFGHSLKELVDDPVNIGILGWYGFCILLGVLPPIFMELVEKIHKLEKKIEILEDKAKDII